MDRDTFTRLVLASARIDLVCETLYCPDAGPARAERPLDFVLRVAGGACTYYSPTARAFVPVDDALHARLLALAEASIAAGNRHPFPDTAVGRHITTLRLRVDDQISTPREVSCGLNHLSYAGEIDAASWVDLLRGFADLASPHDDDDLARWCFVMRACAPQLLTPVLATTLVMPLEPGRYAWSAPLTGRGLYLRLGQPPGDSALYRIAPSLAGAEVLPVEADGREGPPLATLASRGDGFARWSGPMSATPYRGPAGAEVDVIFAHGAVTVRAGRHGSGVYLQRA